MTAFVVLLLPVTAALGAWQIARGMEKSALEMQFFAAEGQLPMPVVAGVEPLPYARIRMTGRYLPGRNFLVDNRVQDGRVGYGVVSLFEAADARIYLVDRGWVAAPASRDELPHVDAPRAEVTLTGTFWRDGGGVDWADEERWSGRWPERIQRLDPERLIAHVAGADAGLRARLVGREVRIDPGSPGALMVGFDAPNFAPQRHYGYAAQWFGLALVLVVLYVIHGLRGAR